MSGDRHIPSVDRYGRAILTVGDLRALLAGVDDAVHVVMDDGQGWYVNIGETIVPGDLDDAEFQCVTFDRGESYDSRQA